jgi:hypothetical protein
MFKHDLIENKNITSIDTEVGRFYTNDEGDRFPSVTTFLSAVLDKSGLDEWRKRVGDEEADRATNRGARRGTALHLACEKYVLNEPLPKMMPSTVVLFNQVKPKLDAKLDVVLGVEIPLMSPKLRLGGRCDLVCEFDGKKTILDFKTTNWWKDRDMLYGYFIQETVYSLMLLEMYGVDAPWLVTISAGDSEPEAQVITEHRDTWIRPALKLIKQFYQKNS